jgi:hypothetical protein
MRPGRVFAGLVFLAVLGPRSAWTQTVRPAAPPIASAPIILAPLPSAPLPLPAGPPLDSPSIGALPDIPAAPPANIMVNPCDRPAPERPPYCNVSE